MPLKFEQQRKGLFPLWIIIGSDREGLGIGLRIGIIDRRSEPNTVLRVVLRGTPRTQRAAVMETGLNVFVERLN